MIKKLSNLYKKYKEIINYLIVGGLTTVVSIVSYYVVKQFIFKENTQVFIQISTVISWVLAVLFAFFTNKKYVFESDKKGKVQPIIVILNYVFSKLFVFKKRK